MKYLLPILCLNLALMGCISLKPVLEAQQETNKLLSQLSQKEVVTDAEVKPVKPTSSAPSKGPKLEIEYCLEVIVDYDLTLTQIVGQADQKPEWYGREDLVRPRGKGKVKRAGCSFKLVSEDESDYSSEVITASIKSMGAFLAADLWELFAFYKHLKIPTTPPLGSWSVAGLSIAGQDLNQPLSIMEFYGNGVANLVIWLQDFKKRWKPPARFLAIIK